MSSLSTRISWFSRLYTFLWWNKRFHEVSPVFPDLRSDIFTSPVDATVAYTGVLWEDGSFISKHKKIVSLDSLLEGDAQKFAGWQYINLYLSPKNRHFFVTPYAGILTHAFIQNGTAILPICTGIETVFGIEIFYRAILSNATITTRWTHENLQWICIAVGSLNVNHIDCIVPSDTQRKKWEYFGKFFLGSSMIVIIPPEWELLIWPDMSVTMGKPLARIIQDITPPSLDITR